MPEKKDQREQMQKITMYTGIGVLVVVLILVGIYLFTGQGSRSGSTAVDVGSLEERLPARPSLGSDDAPIQIVEFADFKCPACKAFHEAAFYNLKREFIDTGKAQLIFVQFPIPNVTGTDSMNAANAAECLFRQSEAAFWAFYNAVYENQGPEQEQWATPDRLLELVRDYVEPLVDIDEADLQQCIAERRYQDEIDKDKQLGLNLGVRGTPTIVLNGEMLDRWGPYSSLKARIERKLEEIEPAAQ